MQPAGDIFAPRSREGHFTTVSAALSDRLLDDDDYLLPEGLQALLNLAEHTGCYAVYGAYNLVNDEDVLVAVNRPEVRGNTFDLFIG